MNERAASTAIPALDVANYFVQIASQEDESDLTNLKLQKLLYFAQGKHLAQFGKPLFNEDVEAWDYGPVVQSVYHQFKQCGAFPITAFDIATPAKLPQDKATFLNQIWDEYAKYSAGYLVDLTHEANSPWKKHYESGRNNVIPREELKHYFASRAV